MRTPQDKRPAGIEWIETCLERTSWSLMALLTRTLCHVWCHVTGCWPSEAGVKAAHLA